MRAETRATCRLVRHEPKNAPSDAPSRSLMAHQAYNLARFGDERTREEGEGTRRINERTGAADDRTRDVAKESDGTG
jgi:hypothetical protein